MRTIQGRASGDRVAILILSTAIILGLHWGSNRANADPPDFANVTSALGLDGIDDGPAAWGDYNNDGYVDLLAFGTVWRNNAAKNFTKVFYANSWDICMWADYDNDGYLDMFTFAAYYTARLYHNDGGAKFTLASFMPTLSMVLTEGASWADYNNDGYVDLYVGGYEEPGVIYLDNLVFNNQDGTFRDPPTKFNRRSSRGITSCDWDEDGDMDVYISNYRLQPNTLFRNKGAGVLRDVAGSTHPNARNTDPGWGGGHSIGAAWGDFDNDGHFDLFAGNFAHDDGRGDQPESRFLRNRGPDHDYRFEDLGQCGVFYQESYASPAVADFDNDGDLDLFFTTVYGTASFGRPNHPVLFRNEGNWKFTDVTDDYGLNGLGQTYQAAWADYDNDGYLDLITDGKLFRNPGGANHWVKIKLIGGQGSNGLVNKAAIGAQVRIDVPGLGTLTRQVEAGTGEGNQNEATLHFGLGGHDGKVNLRIQWPDGSNQTVNNVAVDRLIRVNITPPSKEHDEVKGPLSRTDRVNHPNVLSGDPVDRKGTKSPNARKPLSETLISYLSSIPMLAIKMWWISVPVIVGGTVILIARKKRNNPGFPI